MSDIENQKKSIRKLSHKLRNPLSTILGYAEVLLLNSELPEEEQDMLRAIKKNCKKMDRILTEVNDEYDQLENLAK